MQDNLLPIMEDTKKFINRLDEVDDLSIEILKEFFKNHPEFGEIYLRLQYDYVSGAGVSRALRNMWIEYMSYSSEELIEFYERTTRKGEEPHYENLMIVFLLGFIGSTLAGIVAIEYEKHRKEIIETIKNVLKESQERVHQIKEKIKEKFLQPIRYLFKGFILREMLREGKISRQEHDEILKGIKGIELYGRVIGPTDKYVEFARYEEGYLKKHSLCSYENILEKLFEILVQKYGNGAKGIC